MVRGRLEGGKEIKDTKGLLMQIFKRWKGTNIILFPSGFMMYVRSEFSK
jgi:hypothetical protein